MLQPTSAAALPIGCPACRRALILLCYCRIFIRGYVYQKQIIMERKKLLTAFPVFCGFIQRDFEGVFGTVA